MAFALPVPDGEEGASLTLNGLSFRGEIIPYADIKEIVCTDDELSFIFHEKEGVEPREDIILNVEENCSHQLLDIEVFISTHMMQLGDAKWDEKREKMTNLPKFNTRKIRKSFTKAYSYGG